MPPKESLYSDDWIRIAEKDLDRAKKLLAEKDPELAGFCLQQALEKFFKAFLLAKGWPLRRIHNLDSLLDEATTYDGSLEQYRRVCQRISAFYLVERYPFMAEAGITLDDVATATVECEELIVRLRLGVHQ